MKKGIDIQTGSDAKTTVPPIKEPDGEIISKERFDNAQQNFTELGILKYESKDYAEAIQYFNCAITRDEMNEALWVACGMAFLKLEQFSNAILYFDKALSYNSQYMPAVLHRGLAYTRLEKYVQALKDFNTVLADDPTLITALHYKGNALLFSGQTIPAVSTYLEYLSKNKASNHDEVWYNLGCAFAKLSLNLNAIHCYNQALQNNLAHVDALINTAHAYFSLEKYAFAIAFFTKALLLNANDVETWTNLGITYEKLKHNQEAFTCFQNATQIIDYAPAKLGFKRLEAYKNPPFVFNQKKLTENSKITLIPLSAANLLLDLETNWPLYKKGLLDQVVNRKLPPPPPPPKPLLFLDMCQTLNKGFNSTPPITTVDLKICLDNLQDPAEKTNEGDKNQPH